MIRNITLIGAPFAGKTCIMQKLSQESQYHKVTIVRNEEVVAGQITITELRIHNQDFLINTISGASCIDDPSWDELITLSSERIYVASQAIQDTEGTLSFLNFFKRKFKEKNINWPCKLLILSRDDFPKHKKKPSLLNHINFQKTISLNTVKHDQSLYRLILNPNHHEQIH